MFDESGELDVDGSRAHVRRLVDDGAQGIVLAGTSGEFIGMTTAERNLLAREVAAELAGEVPLIVGTGAFSTRESIELTTAAMEAGASAALVILPYYQRPNRGEVMEHFRAVARASGAPIFVYNNPGNTGTAPLSGEDIGALEAEVGIVGVKSTFPTVHEVAEVRDATTPDFRVFYGGFMAPLEGLAAGACGWVSGILNVVLPSALRMRAAIEAGDLPAARAIWAAEILPVRSLYTRQPLGELNDLGLYRAMLTIRGRAAGHSRAPLQPLTAEQYGRLGKLMEDRGLL